MLNDQENTTIPTSPSIENEPIADKISEELQVNLPGQNLPTPIRLIAFFTLIGGLGIVGSIFTDIIRPQGEGLGFYILRTSVGIVAILIAYGIIERQRWAVWLYGFMTIIALIMNPVVAIFPGAIVAYLALNRNLFTPSIPDVILTRVVDFVIVKIRKSPPSSPQ